MSKDIELILNNVFLALQLCLALWQITKLTPVGAFIQGVVSWFLRPLGLSKTYSALRIFDGRVFKEVNCFVLQPEIPSARTGGVKLGSEDRLQLHVRYLGKRFVLERMGSDRNMLFVDGKMCYYIIPTVWEELQFWESVTDLVGFVQRANTHAIAIADDDDCGGGAAAAAAEAADVSLTSARPWSSVVLKGHREFWEEVSTGGIMSFVEVLDGLILHNQHFSLPLADHRLLPVNLSVSEENFLKILNLLALFLQTKKEKVHWRIPTSLSFISALLEFSTSLRVRLYTIINALFCSIMHSMCDRLPRPFRRQVYSLGTWVEDLKPTNDIELRIQRGDINAIIAGGAKIDREGACLVPWLYVAEEEHRRRVIINKFIDMTCTYFVPANRCKIDAPTVSMFTVECRSMEEYQCLITLVSCMAKNRCGSLKSRGPHNKVSVRGFRESVLCYVKSGFPPVYELILENVVLT